MLQESEIQDIYKEIGEYSIELDPDPTVAGPNYISKQLSLCRNYLNRVALIRVRLSSEKRSIATKLSGENTHLRVERDQLLATNEMVKKQPSIKDREAVVNTLLSARLARIEVLNGDLLDLKGVDAAVEFIHNELIRTSSEIKAQKSLLEVDRYHGTGYGDESPSERDSKGRPLPPDQSIDDEVASLLKEMDLSTTNPTTEAVTPVEEPEEVTPVESVTAVDLVVVEPNQPVLELELVAVEPKPVVETLPEAPVAPPASKADEPLGNLAELEAFVAGVDVLSTAEIKPTEAKKRRTKAAVVPPPPPVTDEFDMESLLASL
jgi:hypothetical protein